MFGIPFGAGAILSHYTDGGLLPLLGAAILMIISCNLFIRAWHRHCVRHNLTDFNDL